MRTILSTFLLIAMIFVSCSQDKQNRPADGMIKDYSVLTLTPKTVTIHNNFPATIEGQQVIEIRPMISGYIQEIYVKEGDHVRKGQMLFKIKNPQYEQDVITAQASINSADAEVNAAKIEIEKVRPLVEKQIVSEYRLTSAKLILEAKEAMKAQAEAAYSNAKTNLDYTNIRSPQDGIIGTFPYKIGALVSSNSAEALTTLSDIENIFAYFSINEKQLLNLLTDSKGITIEDKVVHMPEATLILANSEEYPEKGKVEMASGLISTETGSATFKAVFPNSLGLMRSGSSATVSIPEIKENVLVIPQEATFELQNKRFIYVLEADNKVKSVAFTSTPSDDGKFFLVSEGLKPGDKVVTEGIASLNDGNTIVPKEINADSLYQNLH